MDFLHDQLAGGLGFRVLTVVVVQRVAVGDVAADVTRMALDTWSFEHRITLDSTRPGKPTESRHIESMNARFRDECPSVHRFHSLAHAETVIEAWRV